MQHPKSTMVVTETDTPYQRPSVQQQIDEQVSTMEARLAELKSLQAKLERNPDVADILNAATALGLR